MEPRTLKLLSRQAKLQKRTDNEGGIPSWEFLDEKAADRLKVTLHEACEGDVYFDLEGSPFSTNEEGALSSREYLWGVSTQDKVVSASNKVDVFGGEFEATKLGSYIAWWGHDDVGEEEAFVGFMTWLKERLRLHPNLHVYHYGAYEMSALKRLAGRFGKCEDILDDCLRRGVFVDLYSAVKRSLVIGEPKYSIKNVEKLWRKGGRGEGVAKGDDSIVAYQVCMYV
jgi:predicted RecB family nuclease